MTISLIFNKLKMYFLGGYTFYFRWPVFRVEHFSASSFFLGPWMQGVIFALCAFCLNFFQIFSPQVTILFSSVFLSCLTGFFHEDGFADTLDSLGVSKFDGTPGTLEKIHGAMKDSRLGAFGVNGVVFIWLFRCIAFFEFKIDWQSWALVVFASRFVGLFVAWVVSKDKSLTKATRSGHLMQEIGSKQMSLYSLAFVGTILALNSAHVSEFIPFFLSVSGSFFVCYIWLKKISVRSDGLSGDLIGSTILIAEMVLPVIMNLLPRIKAFNLAGYL